MMYKNTEKGYIVSISKGAGEIAVTEEEYNSLLSIIRSAPSAPDGYVYLLRADTLEWELAELPPDPEPEDEELDDSEALAILLGGAQ